MTPDEGVADRGMIDIPDEDPDSEIERILLRDDARILGERPDGTTQYILSGWLKGGYDRVAMYLDVPKGGEAHAIAEALHPTAFFTSAKTTGLDVPEELKGKLLSAEEAAELTIYDEGFVEAMKAGHDPDAIAEITRVMLRDVARIRGTRPPALAAVENFILDWLTTHPDQHGWTAHVVSPSDCGWCAYIDPPPKEFFNDYAKWQESLPVAQRLENQPPHELDDPVHMLFWDLETWLGLVWQLPPPHLHEAVLVDVFACQREIDTWTRDAIWRQRYPEADHALWEKWLNDSHEVFRPRADR